jgi:hypothetical protein
MLDLNAQATLSPFQFNQLLMRTLADDTERAALYAQLATRPEALRFQSAADADHGPGEPPCFHQTVVLLTRRAHIEQAMRDDRHFSNAPYTAMGSGTFMLGLDGVPHALQRGLAQRVMRYNPAEIAVLCELAFRTAAVLPLSSRDFNAAALAEQAALRFAAMLFGFPLGDHPYLEAAMRSGYSHLVYQIVGRHFSYQPQLAAEAQRTGIGFLLRTGELLSALARGERHADLIEIRQTLAGLGQARGLPGLDNFTPVCERVVSEHSDCSGTELAVIVGGLMAGLIGNVQAAVAIALQAVFDAGSGPEGLVATAALAHQAQPGSPARQQLQQRLMAALADNPPTAFLPRKVSDDVELAVPGGPPIKLAKGTQVLLAIGAGTREAADRLAAPPGAPWRKPPEPGGDPLLYGGPASAGHIHQCLGDYIATPLITEVFRRTLMLPGLAQQLDASTGTPQRLAKTWGFRCDNLPLAHARDRELQQQPLAIIMPIKAPVAANAEKLKTIIGVGAPRIELRLAQSRQVHFAYFLLLDNDSKLALFTFYDGGLDAYIKHFARTVGPLFDTLFECLDGAPPLPVAQHPDEFVDAVRRYNAQPLGNYVFSAYPLASVAMIRDALGDRAGGGAL